MSTTVREIKLHPLSRDFVWSMPAPHALSYLSTEQYRAFDKNGFVKLEAVFKPAEVASVIAAIDPIEQKGEEWLRGKGGKVSISEADVITFSIHLVTRSDVLRTFAAHPKVKDICHDLIGDDVRLYWDQSVYKKTGKEQEFPWHQ